MIDYLFCHIAGCSYKRGIDLGKSKEHQMEEADKVIADFKAHLKTHLLDDLVDSYFDLIMMLREEM